MKKPTNKAGARSTSVGGKNSVRPNSTMYIHGQQPGREPAAHHQQCEALFKKATGWQRIFLAQLLTQSSVNIYQAEKLRVIAKQLEDVDDKRLCRYCFSRVNWQDENYYVCSQCGECLNLEFISNEMVGGAADE